MERGKDPYGPRGMSRREAFALRTVLPLVAACGLTLGVTSCDNMMSGGMMGDRQTNGMPLMMALMFAGALAVVLSAIAVVVVLVRAKKR